MEEGSWGPLIGSFRIDDGPEKIFLKNSHFFWKRRSESENKDRFHLVRSSMENKVRAKGKDW